MFQSWPHESVIFKSLKIFKIISKYALQNKLNQCKSLIFYKAGSLFNSQSKITHNLTSNQAVCLWSKF